MKYRILFPIMALAGVSLSHANDAKKPWYQEGSFYGSFAGGAGFFGDGTVNVQENPSGAADFDIDTATSFALRVGHGFGPLRLEGELHYTDADISTLDSDTGPINVSSGVSSLGFMANALWDFDVKPFTVSAGFGVGFHQLDYDAMIDRGNVLVADCSDSVFANQFLLSISYPVNDQISVGANYRYLMVQGFDDSGRVDTNDLDSSSIRFDNLNASFLEFFVSYQF